jgi:hypothetical protein
LCHHDDGHESDSGETAFGDANAHRCKDGEDPLAGSEVGQGEVDADYSAGGRERGNFRFLIFDFRFFPVE